MNKTSVGIYIYSENHNCIKRISRAPYINIIERSHNEKESGICVLLVNIDDYETESIIGQAIECLNQLHSELSSEDIMSIHVELNIKIIVSNGDNDPIPGITLPKDYINLAAELGIQTSFKLIISSSTVEGVMNSGAYYYIESNDIIDTAAITKLTGIEPSLIYNKGTHGKYTVVDLNAWGISIQSDNTLPETPIGNLMQRINNPKNVGSYCNNNCLNSHMDITLYGIPSSCISFKFNPTVFTFLNDLSVNYLDLDFMN